MTWKLGTLVGMWQLDGCKQWEEGSLGNGAGSGHTVAAYGSPARGRHPLGSETTRPSQRACAGGRGGEQENCLILALKLDSWP